MLSSEWDLDNEEMYPFSMKKSRKNFYMYDFMESVESPKEAIEVFNQRQPLPSQNGFKLKTWISNNDVCTAVPEDFELTSNTKTVVSTPHGGLFSDGNTMDCCSRYSSILQRYERKI